MKQLIATATLFCIFLSTLHAQDASFHKPEEVLKIMMDSKIQYDITILKDLIPATDNSTNLNHPDYYRRYTSNGFSTMSYTPNDEAVAAFNKAEEAFAAKNYVEARANYSDALKKDTGYYLALTYLGQTYGLEHNWDKAIECYEKEIKQNYIDYLAHWFLADAYSSVGRKGDAKKQILIAHILNRNNPRIKDAMRRIFKDVELTYNDTWSFNPQIELKKNGDNNYKVGYNGVWLNYALAKALWNYEPGYRKTIGGTDSSLFVINSEKEGLLGVLVLADKEKSSTLTDDVTALKNAVKKKMFDEYAYYEILLPEHPSVAYNFPASLVDDIANYVLAVRCK